MQVVAGTNYKVRMDLLCSTSSNSDLVVTVNATVFYPLPAENKPAEVSSPSVPNACPASRRHSLLPMAAALVTLAAR